MILLIIILLLSYFLKHKYNNKLSSYCFVAGMSLLIFTSFLINKNKNVAYEMTSMDEKNYIATNIEYKENNPKVLTLDNDKKIKLNKSNYTISDKDYWSSDKGNLAKVKETIHNYDIKNKIVSYLFLVPNKKHVKLYTISYNSSI